MAGAVPRRSWTRTIYLHWWDFKDRAAVSAGRSLRGSHTVTL